MPNEPRGQELNIITEWGECGDEGAGKRQMNGGYRVPLTYQSAWNLVLFKVKILLTLSIILVIYNYCGS